MKIPPLLFLLLFFSIQINSQNPADTESNTPNSPDSVSNFQPSLAVVIGMLAVMFSLTFILLLYAKFCHRASSSLHSSNHQIHDGLPRSRSPSAAAAAAPGVDKTVVESLPFFRFSSLKGSRDGLDCAVCLARFEDVDVLRLLPKCKHAFHIDCIDQWLDKHSTCPLCRRKVGPDDLLLLQCSSSLRFLWNPPPDLRAEDSNLELELHVEREESHRGSSNRFCIGSSFRKTDSGGGGGGDERLPFPPSMDCKSPPPSPPRLHRLNHKIIIADAVLKNRWSNVSSSDIMFLNSEIMLSDVASERLMRENEERESGDHHLMMNIKEEMERKRLFENKLREINHQNHQTATSSSSDSNQRKLGFEFESKPNSSSSSNSKSINPNEKRSMSEIVVHPRFTELRNNNNSNKDSINVKEERMRRLWLPIASKTVQWFANRERRSSHSQG